MKIKPLVLILSYSLISLLTPSLLACEPPPPDCGACQVWDGDECVPIGCLATGCPGLCDYCDSLGSCECECAIPLIGGIGVEGLPACPGDEIYFDIVRDNVCDCVVWIAPGGHPSGQVGGCDFHTHWDTHGEKTVTVSTCSDYRQRKVWVGELCEGVPGCCGENKYCCEGLECCDSDTECCSEGICVPKCSGGPYTAIYCGCSSGGGDGWNECSVQKTYHTCICSANCNDTNRQAWATGTSYSQREVELGRTCNGAPYCGVTNVKGKHPIGDSPCFVTYYGCD